MFAEMLDFADGFGDQIDVVKTLVTIWPNGTILKRWLRSLAFCLAARKLAEAFVLEDAPVLMKGTLPLVACTAANS